MAGALLLGGFRTSGRAQIVNQGYTITLLSLGVNGTIPSVLNRNIEDTVPSLNKEWILTEDTFNKLLGRLDLDRELAAEKYEDIRQMLIVYFESRGSPFPYEQCDETIDRVARKLAEGREIYTGSPGTYFYAVARNVWREWLAEPGRVTPLDALPQHQYPSVDPREVYAVTEDRRRSERKLDCLERCLRSLPPEQRELITLYYRGERGAKIEGRRDLARRLGVPLNALRIRASRLRAKLEACVRRCVGDQADG